MKRLGNLYENIYDLDNIEKAYKEVCKNTRNERKGKGTILVCVL